MKDLDLEFDVLVGNYLVAAGTGKRGISQTEYVHLSPMQRMAEIQAAITGLEELKEKVKQENARLREAVDLTQTKVARLQKAMLDVMYFAGDEYNDGVELTPGAKHALDRVKETALEAVRASK